MHIVLYALFIVLVFPVVFVFGVFVLMFLFFVVQDRIKAFRDRNKPAPKVDNSLVFFQGFDGPPDYDGCGHP